MSHFTVAVLHRPDQDVETLLAPYDESLRVEKYIEFTRQEAIDHVRKHYAKMADKTDDECWHYLADDAGEGMTDEEGNIYSTYNPKSKWDWWSEGGRWSGMLKLKDGGTADTARIGDIDFTPEEAEYKRALRFWDVIVEHKPQHPGEDFFSIYRDEYYRQYYGDRETYARTMAAFSTYAVVTPDGEWHQKGQMGWWGMSSETPDEAKSWEADYMKRFIETADPELILTVVDCHI